MQKGQKVKLESTSQATLEFNVTASFKIDISCFGLDSNDKLSDERYMVFYNQLASPNNEVKLVSDVPNSKFSVDISKLPSNISKLVFTAAIDPEFTQNMSQLDLLNFKMNEHEFVLKGSDFNQEKAIMIVEIYNKDGVWRLGANGQGFNGGLEALLVHFGGTVAESTPQPVKVSKISLEKRFEEKAPQLVSLAKKASVSLEKHKLTNVRAKTAFVIDASGSMSPQYRKGKVQETLNRVFPLGVHFDDDEQLETWAFANKSKKMSNIEFSNYKSYVEEENNGWQKWMSELNCAFNNEPVVIRQVIEHFAGIAPPVFEKKGLIFGAKETTPDSFAPSIASKTPVFIIFISDGGVSKNDHIKFLLKWSSTLPIFWQFVGIGGSSYGVLKELDNLTGRYIDNANFFDIDDLSSISESELYDRMINEFPKWLELAYGKGMIDNYRM